MMVPLTRSSSTEDYESELPSKTAVGGATQPGSTCGPCLLYLRSTCVVLTASPGMLLLVCRYTQAPNAWPSLPLSHCRTLGCFSGLLSFQWSCTEAAVPPGPPDCGYSPRVLGRVGAQMVRRVRISTWLVEPPHRSSLRC